MDAQSGSRALGAASDLVDLLRLAQAAVERLASELYGAPVEHAGLLAREVHRVRRSAERLRGDVERFVAEAESA